MDDAPKRAPHGEHTHGRANGSRCKCGVCKAAARQRQRDSIARNKAELAAGTWKGRHGTIHSARKLGCHCDVCQPVHDRVNRKPAIEGPTFGIYTETADALTVTHWPRWGEDGKWQCPACGEVFVR